MRILRSIFDGSKLQTAYKYRGLLTLLMIFSLCVPAFSQSDGMPVQAEKPDFTASEIDIDGDGISDATIETPLLGVKFSSRTGSPCAFYLKGSSYGEYIYPPVIKDLGYVTASDTNRPFTMKLSGLSEAVGYNLEVMEGSAPDSIVVKAVANVAVGGADAHPLALTKQYTFFKDSYHFTLECLVTNLQEQLSTVGDEMNGSLTLSYGPGLFMDPFGPVSLLALSAGKSETKSDASAITSAGSVLGAYNGIGLRDQYFCILLDTEEKAKISASAFEVKSADPKQKPQNGRIINCSLPSFNLGAKESRSFAFRVYAGPMLIDELAKINRSTVSEYGFLSTVLLRILQFFYALIPNYGLAIIFLTCAVRLILYPLTLKQTKSMAQMQKIQPMVQDLKDRFKDNPQKFNEEVLKLYQKNNVNPLGGCLPLLLQLPVLIALYNTIRIAVELRKVPFLWISDLSKADPLIILPFAIAALMYYQQTKTTTDPQQQQMMAFMPIFMFAITWTLPAGLLVYWFASSVLGLIQQLHANRITAAIKKEEPLVQNN